MTTTEERPRITRPGAGVDIEPRRLVIVRNLRGMKRRQVAEAITALGWTDGDGNPVTWGQDVLGKYETGQRRPSIDAFRALCEVLACDPRELMAGGPDPAMPEEAKARETRMAYNSKLRDFAKAHGLKYKNRGTSRVYYGLALKDAYASSVALKLALAKGDPEEIALARMALEEALAKAPKDPQARSDPLSHLEQATGIGVPGGSAAHPLAS